jgi:hypothetical protein
MGFASAYLHDRTLFPEFIKEAPDLKTGIIIVIPAYDEPGIVRLLDSLHECDIPPCTVEVFVVVNAPSGASRQSLENNGLTINNIQVWKRIHREAFFRLFYFDVPVESIKGWGVGLARKTGMDEAVRRFETINRPEGIILCLDADCQVSRNYIVEVYNEFLCNRKRHACSIYFEHPLKGVEFSADVYQYIAQYELHLRYYLQALIFTGFPDVFHTVGSATGVRALAYVKSGGMNRKQAGEDFYFIQKLIPAGGYFYLNTTTVLPSPRPSFRVPFGTGASISKLAVNIAGNLETYDLGAFRDLKLLFGQTENLYGCKSLQMAYFFSSLPVGIKTFISEDEFIIRLIEIKNNTAGYLSFRKRFYSWFNMFRIVKYLNFVHRDIFVKKTILSQASDLLLELGQSDVSGNAADLLARYRSLEKGI